MKPKVLSIKVERILDENPDLSWLGEYSDEPEEGAIDLWARYGSNSRTWHYFNPENPEYAEEDLKYLERYQDGEFHYMGIQATALLGISWRDNDFTLELVSDGIWGISSEDKAAYEAYALDELAQLKRKVRDLGVSWPRQMAHDAMDNPRNA